MTINDLPSRNVLVLPPHPWAGHTGTVVGAEKTAIGPALRVKLSDALGQECYIYDKSQVKFI